MQALISGLRLSYTGQVQHLSHTVNVIATSLRRGTVYCEVLSSKDEKEKRTERFKDFARERISRIRDDSRRPLQEMQQLKTLPNSESVHQLRVGLRRGRTVSRGFSNILDFPKDAREKNISHILAVLGGQRDKDVMQETFSKVLHCAGKLPDHELLEAEKASEELLSLHQQAAEGVLDMVHQDRPKHVLDALEEWVLEPRFKKAAGKLTKLPAQEAGPAMLLPMVEKVFSDPGWKINTIEHKQKKGSSIQLSDVIDSDKCEKIHGLRKQLRELRYMMEFLVPLYEDTAKYASQLQHVKKLQDQLGKLQDLQVLGHFLEPRMSKMPTIAATMLRLHSEVWDEWLENRKKLRKRKRNLLKAVSNPYRKDLQQTTQSLVKGVSNRHLKAPRHSGKKGKATSDPYPETPEDQAKPQEESEPGQPLQQRDTNPAQPSQMNGLALLQ